MYVPVRTAHIYVDLLLILPCGTTQKWLSYSTDTRAVSFTENLVRYYTAVQQQKQLLKSKRRKRKVRGALQGDVPQTDPKYPVFSFILLLLLQVLRISITISLPGFFVIATHERNSKLPGPGYHRGQGSTGSTNYCAVPVCILPQCYTRVVFLLCRLRNVAMRVACVRFYRTSIAPWPYYGLHLGVGGAKNETRNESTGTVPHHETPTHENSVALYSYKS
jgi:hypothetical protein